MSRWNETHEHGIPHIRDENIIHYKVDLHLMLGGHKIVLSTIVLSAIVLA